jgi:hypothetical protein
MTKNWRNLLPSWLQASPLRVNTHVVDFGAVGKAFQGYSVALSSDGKTASLGGIMDAPQSES